MFRSQSNNNTDKSYEKIEKSKSLTNAALATAITGGQLKDIEKMLSEGADPNYQFESGGYFGWSMLAYAVYENKIEAVKILLKQPTILTNVNFPNGWWKGRSLLYYALHKAYVSLAVELINYRAYSNDEDINGMKPLAYAVYYNMTAVVEALLTQGENPNEETPFKDTFWSAWGLLDYSLRKGNYSCALCLLKNNISIKDINNLDKTFPANFSSNLFWGGWTYLAYAIYNSLDEITDELLKKGASPQRALIYSLGKEIPCIQYVEDNQNMSLGKKLREAEESLKNKEKKAANQFPQPELCDFKEIISKGYIYIDKTEFISKIIDDKSLIKSFSMPYGFGKTLNLSMLNYFFNKESQNHQLKKNFEKLNKAKQNLLNEHFSKYTVINLNFKNLFIISYQDAFERFCRLLGELYYQHKYLLKELDLDKEDKEYFESIMRCYYGEKVKEGKIKLSLNHLIKYLNNFNKNQNVIILVDNLDASFNHFITTDDKETKENAKRITDLVFSFIDEGLKDSNFFRAIFMNTLPIISIYPTFKKVKSYTLQDPFYATNFSYTETEMKEQFKNYNFRPYLYSSEHKEDLYCPALINELANKKSSISENDIVLKIKDVFKTTLNSLVKRNNIFRQNLGDLIEKGYIQVPVHTAFDYLHFNTHLETEPERESAEATIMWSILLANGFLNKKPIDELDSIYTLHLANEPAKRFFSNLYINANEPKSEISNNLFPKNASPLKFHTPPQKEIKITNSSSSKNINEMLTNTEPTTSVPSVKNEFDILESINSQKLSIENKNINNTSNSTSAPENLLAINFKTLPKEKSNSPQFFHQNTTSTNVSTINNSKVTNRNSGKGGRRSRTKSNLNT